jgi:GNAT superfamily N-acetyltransferase
VDRAASGDQSRISSDVVIAVEDPAGAGAQRCVGAYFAELDGRVAGGFDPRRALPADAHELREPDGVLLLARLEGEAVGCGAVKLHREGWAEIKRMWISSAVRGRGIGRRLLGELEERARARGMTVARLDTNEALREAISLYESAGYVEIDAFNDEPHATHWFEKRL